MIIRRTLTLCLCRTFLISVFKCSRKPCPSFVKKWMEVRNGFLLVPPENIRQSAFLLIPWSTKNSRSISVFCKTHDMVLLWSVELVAILHDVWCSNKLPVQLHVQGMRPILWLKPHVQSRKVQEHLTLWPGNALSGSYKIRLLNWSLNLFSQIL